MLFIIAAAQKICKNNLKSAKKTENFPGSSPFFCGADRLSDAARGVIGDVERIAALHPVIMPAEERLNHVID